jgi:hypothetical protein
MTDEAIFFAELTRKPAPSAAPAFSLDRPPRFLAGEIALSELSRTETRVA